MRHQAGHLASGQFAGRTPDNRSETPSALKKRFGPRLCVVALWLPKDGGKIFLTRLSFKDVNEVERIKKCDNCTPDWKRETRNGDHLWCRTSASGDLCSVEDNMCVDSGSRLKCTSCKMIAHTKCIPILVEKLKLLCRLTFQDAEIGAYRENTAVNHHWVSRRSQTGRCRSCGKSFGGKVTSLLNETVAMSCSWCKEMCHGRESCFVPKQMETESCDLGPHANLIVPPTWIVKLSHTESEKSQQVFAIKPIPSSASKPLLVFINPKSGGNQGSKLLRRFQGLLNPRQVFDLAESGPTFGLELYRRVPNLRILVCGGDGSVGWLLSVLDDLKVTPAPPIAVLPLGTGNDLARSLGWGGGYTDEPLSKVLTNVEEGDITKLDRWFLKLDSNPEADMTINEDGRKNLPLNVFNNYFSLGVDALIALEFHEAREARPKKFSSRFRNKMFYGQAGGKDLIQRRWKDLCNFVTLECDGQDMTGKLKELKVHSILFLNISSYGGGTHPWCAAAINHFHAPSTEDGMIEVIGLTTYQLPLLQAGGHGTPIAQCKKAKVVTSCTIPVQVDGEPCKLLPSVIVIEILNTVNMITKTKKRGLSMKKEIVEKTILPVTQLTLEEYEREHHRKESLEEKASSLGSVSITVDTDLSEIRSQVHELLKAMECKTERNETHERQEAREDISGNPKTTDWWFLDSCNSEKYYRIDQAQEHLHYINDICDRSLCIVVQQQVTDDVTSDVGKEAEPDGDDVKSQRSQSSGDYRVNEPEIRDLISEPEIKQNEEEPEIRNLISEPEIKHNKEETEIRNLISEPEIKQNEEEPEIRDLICEPQIKQNKEETEINLFNAAKMGDLEQVALLHAQGHDLGERDHEGRTALHHAAFIGNTSIVRYLTAYAPISVLDAQDDIMYHTALHRAATRRDRLVCSILVTSGASLDLLDKQGYTAQQLAAIVGDQVLADYLECMKNPMNL